MSNRRVHVAAPHLEAALWPALTRLGLEPQRRAEHSVLTLQTSVTDSPRPTIVLEALPTDASLQRELWRVCPELAMFTLGEATIDLKRRAVRTSTGETRLSPTELRLLLWMRGRRAQVVTRDELLAEVWGYAQGVQTRTITATMHRLRGKIEPDPSQPRFLLTEPGIGYRLELADEVAQTPVLFGRTEELRALLGALEPGVLTLCGPGGIGKSRLLQAAFQLVAGRYSRTAALDVSPGDSVRAIRTRVASALGVRLGAEEGEGLSEAIGADPTLVVLDHAELALDAVRSFLDDWPTGAILLIGSRVPLDHPAETVMPLRGLRPEHATELLLRLARARNPGWSDASIAPLIEWLEGLPFALELAAAQARVLDATAIVDRLKRNHDLRAPADGRHQSLHTVLHDTLETLDGDQQRALQSLCAFTCPVPLDALEHVAGVDAVGALDGLASRALVHRLEEGRWRVLDPVRQVVDVDDTLRTAVGDWLMEQDGPLEEWLAAARSASGVRKARLVRGFGPKLADAGAFEWLREWLASLEPVAEEEVAHPIEVLRARCAVENGEPTRALAQLRALFDGPCGTEARLRAAELALDLGDPTGATDALGPVPRGGVVGLRRKIAEGGVHFLGGRHAEAETAYTEAVEHARRLASDGSIGVDGERWLSVALFSLSVCPFVRGAFHEMVALLQEAVAVAADHPLEHALAGHRLGIALHRLERVDEAVVAMRTAEQTCRRAGLHRTTASILSDLGGVLGEQGMEAEATIRQALVLAQRYELRHFEQTSLINLATVQANREAFDEASSTLEALATTLVASPRPLLSAAHASLSGVVCHGRGDLDEALVWLHEAASGMEALGHRNRTAMVWGRIAWILSLKGENEAAEAAKVQARARIGEGEQAMAWLVEAFAIRADEAAGEDVTERRSALRSEAAGRHRIQVVLGWGAGN